MLIVAIFIPLSPQSQASNVGSVSERTMSIRKIFSSKYTRLMTGFVLISLICVTFIDYSFLNIINVQWETEAEKASFLANFEATVVIFSFLKDIEWFKLNIDDTIPTINRIPKYQNKN